MGDCPGIGPRLKPTTLQILALEDELSAARSALAVVVAERDALKQKLRGTCLVILDKLTIADREVKDMIAGLQWVQGDE